ncbi:hypothetical protein KUV26_10465 [Leisingera daeponensis]|uniref:Uncharacterized protein n=1 Tax=Leisingera daeponensis TaxID=405746 RepID=A0ABS7NF74_9RHOB|nr:hypothetical protein [Leisingera daeponensis]MBY6139858.1 hypothetical protein [Leisingera daeponensis]
MPLELLLALVAGGISAIALLLHLTGRSRQAVLGTGSARTAWLRHFPGDSVIKVLPAASGQAALILTGNGPGLLWAFGADTAGRRLTAGQVRETADGLHFAFNDFAAPSLALPLPEGERRHWLAQIAATAEAA